MNEHQTKRGMIERAGRGRWFWRWYIEKLSTLVNVYFKKKDAWHEIRCDLS